MGHSGKRNADDALVVALACGATTEQAAAKAGVSPRTAHRRLNDPGFAARVQAVRRETVERSAAVLTAAAGEAVRTLLGLLKDPVAPTVRLGAARAVLELGLRFREVVELEAQVKALEDRLRDLDADRGGRA